MCGIVHVINSFNDNNDDYPISKINEHDFIEIYDEFSDEHSHQSENNETSDNYSVSTEQPKQTPDIPEMCLC